MGPTKLTAPMGEVDSGRLGPWARLTVVDLAHGLGTLSPCAFLSSDDLALSVVDLARSAHLTFLDLYEH